MTDTIIKLAYITGTRIAYVEVVGFFLMGQGIHVFQILGRMVKRDEAQMQGYCGKTGPDPSSHKLIAQDFPSARGEK